MPDDDGFLNDVDRLVVNFTDGTHRAHLGATFEVGQCGELKIDQGECYTLYAPGQWRSVAFDRE